jgi:outer membrane receptor protein involved in Fe transport
LGLSVNYLDEFADLDGRKIEPWTTADVRAAWRPDDAGWRNGLEVSVSVRNLFDADAPFYDNPQGIGYDPANADVVGRFVAAQITKRW